MTDTLRTRIAAVLADHQIETHSLMFRCSCLPNAWLASRSDCDHHLADAVIRELTNPIRGCTDPWHWSTGEPYRCPSCGYWIGEGYV